MDIAINVVAFVLLASLTGYVIAAGMGGLRRGAAAARSAEIENELLSARVAQIMDERRIEREKSELSWNGFRKFSVARKVQEGSGICSFYLSPHDRRDLPPFEPGQYLTFQLDIPGEKKSVVRCYSLSDSPTHPDYYRCSIKAMPPPRDKPDLPPGLSSNFFHDRVQEGDILDVKAPGGHFFLDMTKQTPIVLIGGGIGLTPVLSMLNAVVESGSKREVWFFYGVRNSKEHVMKEDLEKAGRENENVHICVCYSNPDEGDEEGRDYQHAERVSLDLFKRLLPSNNYDFYMCGPPPMMSSVVSGLEEWSVPESRIHYEAFGPATVKKTPKAEDAIKESKAGEGETALQVIFAKSGKTLTWNPSAGTLLDFAEENGIDIDSGCRAGNCGTCITAIKEGEVTYEIDTGAKPEDGSCLTCCTVPKTNLTLDA